MFDESEIKHFCKIVGERLGLNFDCGKRYLLADVLQRRLQACRCTQLEPYFDLISSEAQQEWRALASELTTTETYFFRGQDQFRALAETVLPELIRKRRNESQLRMFSAGCASGEEPYSLAILVQERFPELAYWQLDICGVDLNPEMIAKARQARYHAWSLRETPNDLRDKYFQTQGRDFLLNERIRSMVSFEERNLVTDDFARGRFDIIFCRNVIMYLLPAAAQAAINRITDVLAPGGFLFLGYAETLRGLSQAFHLCNNNDTFYYQKRGEAQEAPLETCMPEPMFAGAVRTIDILTRVPPARTVPEAAAPAVQRANTPVKDGANVQYWKGFPFTMELLRQEKFSEALDVFRDLPNDAINDLDARLLHATLLINCGEPAAAETICQKILRADDLNAGAHYLTAMCRECTGDYASAVEHDRAAVYLDGAFAMPHLHLGRLAKRSGDLPVARRELECAALLLTREDPSRLLLFGGGFSREGLLSLCRAELRACGAFS